MNELKGFSVKMRLNILVMVSFIPFTLMIIFLLWMVYSFSQRYDSSVENITRANVYTADFKESIDYTMYIIVANSERADELAVSYTHLDVYKRQVPGGYLFCNRGGRHFAGYPADCALYHRKCNETFRRGGL